eukprot:COSAG04_NODE_3024_length_3267_cov_2.198548_1_plen_66_part_10
MEKRKADKVKKEADAAAGIKPEKKKPPPKVTNRPPPPPLPPRASPRGGCVGNGARGLWEKGPGGSG